VTPLSAGSSSLQFTMPREMGEMLDHLKALVSHRIPSGDVVEVLSHALRVAIQHEEKQKFAATTKPRSTHRPSADSRYIPMPVKGAVWLRDGGQCTFTSETGKRCQARRLLEFDHIVEVARGGASTVDNIRLRCRHHNQYTAEQSFGAGFMKAKREDARGVAAARRAKAMPPHRHVAAIAGS
jgi:5-methylcytosine-specific restriction endonuclease McrA